ncbi:hypothetical protein FKM82_027601 [Ascaphus truei]
MDKKPKCNSLCSIKFICSCLLACLLAWWGHGLLFLLSSKRLLSIYTWTADTTTITSKLNVDQKLTLSKLLSWMLRSRASKAFSRV